MSQRRIPWFWVGLAVLIVVPIASIRMFTGREAPLPTTSVVVVARHPHDTTAFTQGLVFADGRLFESTGQRGASTVREVEIATGRVVRRHDLDAALFGEGLAAVGDRLVQLTWQAGRGFVYDRETFAVEQEFRYAGEGWGVAFDGTDLLVTDGTPTLRGLDPETFAERWRRTVTAHGRPLVGLNELECVGDELWANVYGLDVIARIRPSDGVVVGWLDASALAREARTSPGADVLNGIALDPASGRLFLTGKNWPTLFEIERPAG